MMLILHLCLRMLHTDIKISMVQITDLLISMAGVLLFHQPSLLMRVP